MLTAHLPNILGRENPGECPTEILLMAARVLARSSLRVLRWRDGELSVVDLAHELVLQTARTYQPGEMPLPVKPRPGLRRRQRATHQEMGRKTASSTSQLRVAVSPKRARVDKEVKTIEITEDITKKGNEQDIVRKDLVTIQKKRAL